LVLSLFIFSNKTSKLSDFSAPLCYDQNDGGWCGFGVDGDLNMPGRFVTCPYKMDVQIMYNDWKPTIEGEKRK